MPVGGIAVVVVVVVIGLAPVCMHVDISFYDFISNRRLALPGHGPGFR